MGISFGKRGIDPSHSGASVIQLVPKMANSHARRSIPSAEWDGPNGPALAAAGRTPNDDWNIALSPQQAADNCNQYTRDMQALVARINQNLPHGCTVLPWSLIPLTCWQGLNAEFLMKTCCFYASHPLNTMLLPADSHTSTTLNLPQHPRSAVPGIVENISRMLAELGEKSQAEIYEIRRSAGTQGAAVLQKYDDVRNESVRKVCALAQHIGEVVLGNDVRQRHNSYFGFPLGS